MIEEVASVFGMLANLSATLTPPLLLCFAASLMLFLALETRYVPLTREEAKMLWKIHKENAKCNAKRMRELKHRGKVIGFECDCGYKRVQKRPII